MNKQINNKCPKCGSNDVVLTKQDKSFVSCNNCKYKVNLVVTPEDKWVEKIVKTEPKCKCCNDTGEIFISGFSVTSKPCHCKSRYSIGDGLHTEEENRETLLKAIIKYSKPKKYPVSEMEEFYDYMSSFIKYPIIFLNEFADKFDKEEESIDDLKRLIGLLKMDNYAIMVAITEGIHPITGCKWDKNDEENQNKFIHLRDRNNKMIVYLESVLKVVKIHI